MLYKVKMHPDSRENKVIQRSKDTFEIYTKAHPERGEANKAMRALLSSYLDIPQSRIQIRKGGRQKSKIIEIIQ